MQAQAARLLPQMDPSPKTAHPRHSVLVRTEQVPMARPAAAGTQPKAATAARTAMATCPSQATAMDVMSPVAGCFPPLHSGMPATHSQPPLSPILSGIPPYHQPLSFTTPAPARAARALPPLQPQAPLTVPLIPPSPLRLSSIPLLEGVAGAEAGEWSAL